MAKQNIKDPGAHHNSSGALIRRFLPYLAKHKAVLFLDLFCAALTTLCDIFLPKIMSTITNSAMGVGITLTAGIGLKELCEKFRAGGDDYNAILSKLLADRLTEALCEWVHIFIRRQMWGYETGPALTPEQIIRSKYRGRRMAFGYPACPDHSLKREVFDLLAADKTTAMRLNDNYMITPEEALCGLFFADAEYFSVGRIDREQLADYAARRNMDIETIEKLIPNNI